MSDIFFISFTWKMKQLIIEIVPYYFIVDQSVGSFFQL